MSVSSLAMAKQIGTTYRVLDYWSRQNYLRPEPDPDGRSGSGVNRKWPESEVPIGAAMVKLVAEGLSVSRSAAIARYGNPSAVLALLWSQPAAGYTGTEDHRAVAD